MTIPQLFNIKLIPYQVSKFVIPPISRKYTWLSSALSVVCLDSARAHVDFMLS